MGSGGGVKPSEEFMEQSHRSSLAAFRSATILRFAKASLLLSLTGIVVSAAIVPLCLDHPRKWFGMEFGPADFNPVATAPPTDIAKELDASSVLAGLDKRLEKIDEELLSMQRRCLIDGRSITIARESNPSSTAIPGRVALVQVEPTAVNVYGAITTYSNRWLYPDDLERPFVLLRGLPVDTAELRFRLTWIGGDGATIGGATSIFTKTGGSWDEHVAVAKCSEVNSVIEKLGRFRIRID
jgi:hypothetical protein